MNKLALKYAHAATVPDAIRHIVDPMRERSSVCGQRLDVGDYVASSRITQNERLCGNCKRMRDWALQLLERKRASA
jgi:hypothetical protein